MVNYQNGKIYKIESLIGGCIYVGSTCQKLSSRMAGHRRDSKKRKDCSSLEVFKYPDVKILLILNYPCNSKEELLSKEAEYIRQLDCVNKRIPGRTVKKYYEDNKEIILKKHKEYRDNNKEKIKEWKVKNYLENKEIILKKNKEYRDNNKELIKLQNKKYRDKNKEIVKLKKKKYYEKNREKISKRNKEKYTCVCGSTFSIVNKLRHNKSKKHLKFIEQQ
jgi:hypothetical protein